MKLNKLLSWLTPVLLGLVLLAGACSSGETNSLEASQGETDASQSATGEGEDVPTSSTTLPPILPTAVFGTLGQRLASENPPPATLPSDIPSETTLSNLLEAIEDLDEEKFLNSFKPGNYCVKTYPFLFDAQNGISQRLRKNEYLTEFPENKLPSNYILGCVETQDQCLAIMVWYGLAVTIDLGFTPEDLGLVLTNDVFYCFEK